MAATLRLTMVINLPDEAAALRLQKALTSAAVTKSVKRLTGGSRTVSASVPTARELEVLHCMVDGLTNRQAAEKLGISHRTVEVHRARLFRKMGAKNASELTRIALSQGWVPDRSSRNAPTP